MSQERSSAPGVSIVTPTLADIYAAQGHFAEAIALIERLVAGRPGDRTLLRRLADYRVALAAQRRRAAALARIERLKVLLRRVRKRRRAEGPP